jgi:hypothetical protein
MYKKNRIKEVIDNGQIPLGMQYLTRKIVLVEDVKKAAAAAFYYPNITRR